MPKKKKAKKSKKVKKNFKSKIKFKNSGQKKFCTRSGRKTRN